MHITWISDGIVTKMKLYIGGYAQGKLDYVLQKFREEKEGYGDGQSEKFVIVDGESIVEDIVEKREGEEMGERAVIINHFHKYIRKELILHPDWGMKEIEKKVNHICLQYPNCTIICDEVGNGIVPIDAFERKYREMVGRICCVLAQRSKSVERIHCGLGMRLK